MRRLALVLLLAAAMPAAAQEQERVIPRAMLPGIGAEDPRRVVNQDAMPWRALGRVQLEATGQRCTGALVGPRTVLTAAHCLVAARSRNLARPGGVHFLLGYRQGEYVAHARVASYRIGPGYEGARGGPATSDWAVLTLATALPADRVLPMLKEAPAPRTPLMLGGYQQDRPEVVLADTNCRALGLKRLGGAALLLHDCAGTRGSSGAPLLARDTDGRWAIAAITSRAALDLTLGYAVPLGGVGPLP
jgi:protease YdgD